MCHRFAISLTISRLVLVLSLAVVGLLRAEPKSPSEAAVRSHSDNYGLRPHDMIEIKVFQEDDLSATVRISRDGTINFPLIGVVKVGGMSAQAAAATIRTLLARDYLVNPQVSVTVRDYSKRRFTVLGEVQRPGAYELPDHDSINLLEAIGLAGGYTRLAEPAKVTLKRVVNGKETVIRLNAKKMAREGDGPEVVIKPGDIVTVGERLF